MTPACSSGSSSRPSSGTAADRDRRRRPAPCAAAARRARPARGSRPGRGRRRRRGPAARAGAAASGATSTIDSSPTVAPARMPGPAARNIADLAVVAARAPAGARRARPTGRIDIVAAVGEQHREVGPDALVRAGERLVARPHARRPAARRRAGGAGRAARRRSRSRIRRRAASGSGSSLPGTRLDDVDPLAARRRRVGERPRPVERVDVARDLLEADERAVARAARVVAVGPGEVALLLQPGVDVEHVARRAEAVVGGEHDASRRARPARRARRGCRRRVRK